MTAILHGGLRNCFFYASFTFSNFYLDFYFPFSIWTFISILFHFFFILFFSIIFQFFIYSITVTFWISSNFFSVLGYACREIDQSLPNVGRICIQNFWTWKETGRPNHLYPMSSNHNFQCIYATFLLLGKIG